MFSTLRLPAGFGTCPAAQQHRRRFWWRLILFLSGFLAIGDVRAERAYLIIDAIKQPATARQPTWIALWGRGGVIHIPTGRTVVEVAAGHYTIGHVDFGKSEYSGFGTVRIPQRSWTRFNATADAITHVGVLQVGPGDEYSRLLRVSLVPRVAQLEWACHSHPELLARLPVRIRIGRRQARLLKVRCKARGG